MLSVAMKKNHLNIYIHLCSRCKYLLQLCPLIKKNYDVQGTAKPWKLADRNKWSNMQISWWHIEMNWNHCSSLNSTSASLKTMQSASERKQLIIPQIILTKMSCFFCQADITNLIQFNSFIHSVLYNFWFVPRIYFFDWCLENIVNSTISSLNRCSPIYLVLFESFCI